MSTKGLIFLFMFIGSSIGGYIPVLMGADFISYASIFWSGIGSLVGIFVGYKIGNV